MRGRIRSARTSGNAPSPARGACHRAALRADPLARDLSPQAGRGGSILPLLGIDLEEAAVGAWAHGDHAIDAVAVLQSVTGGDVVACAHNDADSAARRPGCQRQGRHARSAARLAPTAPSPFHSCACCRLHRRRFRPALAAPAGGSNLRARSQRHHPVRRDQRRDGRRQQRAAGAARHQPAVVVPMRGQQADRLA